MRSDSDSNDPQTNACAVRLAPRRTGMRNDM